MMSSLFRNILSTLLVIPSLSACIIVCLIVLFSCFPDTIGIILGQKKKKKKKDLHVLFKSYYPPNSLRQVQKFRFIDCNLPHYVSNVGDVTSLFQLLLSSYADYISIQNQTLVLI